MPLTVNKWGNSIAIRLPKQLVQEFKLQKDDILDYKISNNKLILEKKSEIPELTVEDLFKDYKGEPVDTTPFIFESKGNEQW